MDIANTRPNRPIRWKHHLIGIWVLMVFEQGLFKCQLTFDCYKCWYCVNEPQSYLKFQYPRNNPNLECFYLVIQGCQLVWTTFLDCHQHLWPGTACWPLHKAHSGKSKVLKISKIWKGSRSLSSSLICAICTQIISYHILYSYIYSSSAQSIFLYSYIYRSTDV